MLYLIVRAKPLSDQYECDKDRTPILITQDDKIVERYLDDDDYEIYIGDLDKKLELF